VESNWRWNVWEMGWSSSPIRLLARLNVTPDIAIGKWIGPLGPLVAYLNYVPILDEWILSAVQTLPFPGAHFPYGYDVEPDH